MNFINLCLHSFQITLGTGITSANSSNELHIQMEYTYWSCSFSLFAAMFFISENPPWEMSVPILFSDELHLWQVFAVFQVNKILREA